MTRFDPAPTVMLSTVEVPAVPLLSTPVETASNAIAIGVWRLDLDSHVAIGVYRRARGYADAGEAGDANYWLTAKRKLLHVLIGRGDKLRVEDASGRDRTFCRCGVAGR